MGKRSTTAGPYPVPRYLHTYQRSQYWRILSNLDADQPVFRVFPDELFHQMLTLGVLQVDDLDSTLSEIFVSTDESVVLAHHDPSDFVHDTCSRAHVAWGEGGVHSSATVCGSW